MAHPKGVLIERLQKEGRQPRFESKMSGPDHEPVFDAEVQVDGEVLGRGTGPNKRTAERAAAEEALAALDGKGSSSSKRGGRSRKRGGKGKSAGSSSRGSGRTSGGSSNARSTSDDASAADSAADADSDAGADAGAEAPPLDGPFEGPWPVFETVLSTSLQIAHDRIAAGLASDDARERIERFALQLYKSVLQDLGEVVEVDEDDA